LRRKVAKKEGKSQSHIQRWLVFGRFLVFMANTPMGVNLTERRFRQYWERTSEHGNTNVGRIISNRMGFKKTHQPVSPLLRGRWLVDRVIHSKVAHYDHVIGRREPGREQGGGAIAERLCGSLA
jgi:hypothetical protein